MKKAFVLSLNLILVAFMLCGCSTASVGVSPSTTPITAKDSYTVLGESTSGSGWGVSVLVIPLSEDTPSKNARDRAIKNGGGNGLIEVSEKITYIPIIPIWTVVYLYKTTVTGTPVQIEHGGAN